MELGSRQGRAGIGPWGRLGWLAWVEGGSVGVRGPDALGVGSLVTAVLLVLPT